MRRRAGTLVLVGISVVLSTACVGAPVGSQLAVPPDTAQQCASQCEAIGAELDAVVLMANNAGCVCTAAKKEGLKSSSAHRSSVAGGVAAVIAQRAAEESRRQQQAKK